MDRFEAIYLPMLDELYKHLHSSMDRFEGELLSS